MYQNASFYFAEEYQRELAASSFCFSAENGLKILQLTLTLSPVIYQH
ncbi:hypothetical protein ymoll0001_30630 [Yersinia mollaretii ATCC 43969]|uniref:Uncharacterized protein n=1 Tax=Yersinia mollaretii (strain ATCC 43969 / DSM 18520 / CIP 103324 / CNY 7263 / WAIP 204) TaxID=349967 RepID=A0ABM9YBY7_YERMW|nr:hypothetical protein ymoll0001_30630 [Yersinia mollaretii ATCC 43969]